MGTSYLDDNVARGESEHNPNIPHGSGLQSVLYYKLVFKHEYSRDELAVYLNKAPDTVYRYCAGLLPVSPDIARGIIRFIAEKNPEDIELLEFYVPPGYIVIKEPADPQTPATKSRKDHELVLSIETGRSIEAIEEAFEDGKLTKIEGKHISAHLRNLAQKALALDRKLKGEAE
jgi:hypothetical protein